MPKIIENLETKLIEEAKKQFETSGYSALTMRSVAKACGVGVGTVYNYFPSKDALVASYMLQDWNKCITAIKNVSDTSDSPEPVALCIFNQIREFSALYQSVFNDVSASAGFGGSVSRYHGLLRSQLAAPLKKFCSEEFTSEFIAEALLTWTIAGKSFDEIFAVIKKCF